jgi:sporulation protein YlmC with PRC-barrel domain
MAKLKRSVKMLVPALGMSLVLGAYAQGTAGQAGPAGQQQQAAGMQPGQQTAVQQGQQQAQQRRDVRLSNLIGMDVRDPAGENLGDINDVIVDLDQGRALYAVIGFGGFLGMGERLFAFPLQAFEMPLDREQLVLNVSRERLQQAPGFDRNQWPDWNDTAYRGEVDRFHGPGIGGPGRAGTATAPGTAMAPGTATAPGTAMAPGATTATAGATGTAGPRPVQGQVQPGQPGEVHPAAPAQQQPQAQQQVQQPQVQQQPQVRQQQPTAAATQPAAQPPARQQAVSNVVRGSELLNRTVRGAAGENLGDINDVVINMADGEMRYAVIGFSQGWFQRDQLVAVPVQALGRSPQHPNDVVLNATRDQLAQAPVFDRDRWPDFRDQQYQSAWDNFLRGFGGGAGGTTTGAAGTTTGGAATGTTGTTGTAGTSVTEGTGTAAGGAPRSPQ